MSSGWLGVAARFSPDKDRDRSKDIQRVVFATAHRDKRWILKFYSGIDWTDVPEDFEGTDDDFLVQCFAEYLEEMFRYLDSCPRDVLFCDGWAFTGGYSGGDPPTESFDYICALDALNLDLS